MVFVSGHIRQFRFAGSKLSFAMQHLAPTTTAVTTTTVATTATAAAATTTTAAASILSTTETTTPRIFRTGLYKRVRILFSLEFDSGVRFANF